MLRIRIQEAQKHTDPTNPDPDSDPVRNTDIYIFYVLYY